MRPVVLGDGRHVPASGTSKIDLHQVDRELLPYATHPTPGSADLCLITDTPHRQIPAHLAAGAVPVEEGPVPRTGARGPITSTCLPDRTAT